MVITEHAFAEFIRACDVGALPWIHHMSYRDFVPQQLKWTNEDDAALPDLTVGPPSQIQAKALKKFYQIVTDRRFLVGHLFYSQNHNNWHLLYFDNRDLKPTNNHFEQGGTHIHLINHFWARWTYEAIWKHFMKGNPKMSSALHIRFRRESISSKY